MTKVHVIICDSRYFVVMNLFVCYSAQTTLVICVSLHVYANIKIMSIYILLTIICTVEPLLKDPTCKGHCTFNLLIRTYTMSEVSISTNAILSLNLL